MRLTIDEDANAVYLYLSEEPVEASDMLGDDVNYDFDSQGNVRGIEVIGARSWFGDLTTLTPEKMLGMFLSTLKRETAQAA